MLAIRSRRLASISLVCMMSFLSVQAFGLERLSLGKLGQLELRPERLHLDSPSEAWKTLFPRQGIPISLCTPYDFQNAKKVEFEFQAENAQQVVDAYCSRYGFHIQETDGVIWLLPKESNLREILAIPVSVPEMIAVPFLSTAMLRVLNMQHNETFVSINPDFANSPPAIDFPITVAAGEYSLLDYLTLTAKQSPYISFSIVFYDIQSPNRKSKQISLLPLYCNQHNSKLLEVLYPDLLPAPTTALSSTLDQLLPILSSNDPSIRQAARFALEGHSQLTLEMKARIESATEVTKALAWGCVAYANICARSGVILDKRILSRAANANSIPPGPKLIMATYSLADGIQRSTADAMLAQLDFGQAIQDITEMRAVDDLIFAIRQSEYAWNWFHARVDTLTQIPDLRDVLLNEHFQALWPAQAFEEAP